MGHTSRQQLQENPSKSNQRRPSSLKKPRSSANLVKTSLTTEKRLKRRDREAEYQLGITHYQKGNYQESFYHTRLAADADHPKALVRMGNFYKKGLGTDTNFYDAIKYYARGALRGEALGWFNLGICHRFGIGTEINLENAFGCFKKAAEKGHPKSYVNLAACYKNGMGTERDLQKACEYYKKALAFDECQDKAQEGYTECQRLIKKNDQLNKQRSSFLLKELFNKAQVTSSHIEVNITYIDQRPRVKH